MKQIQFIIIALVIFFFISCKEVDPLVLPKENDISTISIYKGALEQKNQTLVITNSNTISDILRFIKLNNSGWHTVWDTYPTPQTTVVFRNKSQGVEMLLWFGSNWVGGEVVPISPTKAYLWDLNANKLQELKIKLGIAI